MNKHFITDWIDATEAAIERKRLIDNGTYTKVTLKKSSCKFANGKNKNDGYLCRLYVIDVPVQQVHDIVLKEVVPTQITVEAVVEETPAIELNILKEEEVRYIGGVKHIGRKMVDVSGKYYEVTWERVC